MVSSLWRLQQLKMHLYEKEMNDPTLDEQEESLELSSSSVVLTDETKRMQMLVQSAYDKYDPSSDQPISFDVFSEWFSREPLAIQFMDTIKKVRLASSVFCFLTR